MINAPAKLAWRVSDFPLQIVQELLEMDKQRVRGLASFDAKSALESRETWQRSGKAWGFDSDKGLAADARDLNMPITVEWYKQGDAEATLAKTTIRIEAEYRCQYASQMEPRLPLQRTIDSGLTEIGCGSEHMIIRRSNAREEAP